MAVFALVKLHKLWLWPRAVHDLAAFKALGNVAGPPARNVLADASPYFEAMEVDTCQHSKLHEIGQDFDKDGRLLRLNRCQQCGLLMREYLPMI